MAFVSDTFQPFAFVNCFDSGLAAIFTSSAIRRPVVPLPSPSSQPSGPVPTTSAPAARTNALPIRTNGLMSVAPDQTWRVNEKKKVRGGPMVT